MNDKDNSEILQEMRKQTAILRQANRINTIASIIVGVLVILAVAAYPIILHKKADANYKHVDSMQDARNLLDKGNFTEGIEMTQRLINKNPKYYYGYALMGSAYHELGDMNKAEQYYSKAFEFFPIEDNEKTLKAIRKAKQDQEKRNTATQQTNKDSRK